VSVNVCGLTSKLKFPDFIDFIQKNDIVCINESKLDEFDVPNINIDGYQFWSKHRQKCTRRSGGVGVFVKNELIEKNLISKLNVKDESNVLLFKLHKELCGIDIVCGAIYIEPENSNYARPEVFENLEEDLIDFIDHNIMLIGDFNSRIANLNDLYIDNSSNFLPFSMECNDFSIEEFLLKCGARVKRISKDTYINKYGRQLIALCHKTNMFLLNGRVGSDAGIGKLTCKESSTVDYCITSPNILPYVYDFNILDFDPCFSDVHCAINVTLKSLVNLTNNEYVNVAPISNDYWRRPTWKKDYENNYCNGLDLDRIHVLCNLIDDLMKDDNVSPNDINNIYSEIKSVLHNSAVDCGALKKANRKSGNKRKIKKHKPWWSHACQSARKKLNRARKLPVNRESLAFKKECGKEYKRTIKTAIKAHKKTLHETLRTCKNKSPKDYWKIINDSSESSNNVKECNITSDQFLKHFQSMNMGQLNHSTDHSDIHESLAVNDNPLNSPITETEVLKCITKLKNGKACGSDKIINEFLKCSKHVISKLLTKMFNLVLSKGVLPEDWVIGIIKPLYKNKGDINDVDSYRGITILSCVCKLFTFIINERLKIFLDINKIIFEEQTGFRDGYSTVDHIFTLDFVINYYLSKGKRLYVAFVDYKKAFDTVDRISLWRKLISCGINGPVLNIIYNMYSNAKSCVEFGGFKSDYFKCNVGVRQGENLSPVLFAIFLNDLTPFMNGCVNGLNDLSNDIRNHNDLSMYLKLNILLYADDTVLLAETEMELQEALNAMENYCKINKLYVNVEKSKVVVFSKGKIRNIPQFVYNNSNLEVVFSFTYLGIDFNYNGRMRVAQTVLCNKASRAMFGLISKSRKLYLPIDIQIHLFNSLVKPVALYGSEVWGAQHCNLADKLQLRFLKLALGLKKCTTSVMVRGETGCYPMYIDMTVRVLNYWIKLAQNENNTSISNILYKFMLAELNSNGYIHPWLSFVKDTLNELGMSFVFDRQATDVNPLWFKKAVKLRLIDQYKQQWSTDVNNNVNCLIYRLFKPVFEFENYLIELPFNLAVTLLKFRTRNIKLPGVSFFPQQNISVVNNYCPLCNEKTSDEFHYVMTCSYLNKERTLLIPSNYKQVNVINFKLIMNMKNEKLVKFVKIIVNMLKNY
jgi:hypothetical protein